MKLDEFQVKRICYEAERSFLLSRGRGGMHEWASVPESKRVSPLEIHPAPFDGAFANPVEGEARRRLYAAVRDAIKDLEL